MDFTLFNQILSLGLCLVALSAIIFWMIKKPNKRGWAVPILIYILFSIVFYSTLLFDGLSDSPDVMFWASTKSLLSYITVIIYGCGTFANEFINKGGRNDS